MGVPRNSGKRSVVLYLPRRRHRSTRGISLSLLALCKGLDRSKYQVTIVQDNLYDDPVRVVMEACRDAVCLGITALTGEPIVSGLEISAMAKTKYPGLPIIWGGWHPSIAPDSTVRSPYIDIVVRGQGEETFGEIVQALSEKLPIDSVAGISFKRDGQVIHNPPRAIKNINEFPPMPYELVDVERTIWSNNYSSRVIEYASSFGCPFQCTFCSEATVNQRRYSALEPSRVVEDLERLVKDYRINGVSFVDNLFFLQEERAHKICELILKKGLEISLTEADARVRQMLRYSDATWELLRRAGCKHIFVGAESGLQEALDFLKKGLTVEETVAFAEKAKKYDIDVEFSIMLGLPWDRDINTTHRMVDKEIGAAVVLSKRLLSINRRNMITVLPYTPYPGCPLFDTAVEMGLNPPQTLEGWAQWTSWSQWDNKPRNSPWLTASQRGRIQILCGYIMTHVKYDPREEYKERGPSKLLKWLFVKFYYLAPRLRFKYGVVRWLPDYWFYKIVWTLLIRLGLAKKSL